MTVHENKYLERLKAETAKKSIVGELTKLTKPPFVSFDSSEVKRFSPPLDANGMPCGPCPNCGQGEFWRWPKFHPKHDPRGWLCWFCAPPRPIAGHATFMECLKSRVSTARWAQQKE
jgi:hypothetical protein